jgi:5-methyltetrahydropteroyltriglutamate--homocysteine methyltransferase
MSELPPIPTMGVGSYAAPGWFLAARRLFKPDELGEVDRRELIEDATRVVLDDQIEAGLDVLTDGELRRQRFVFEILGQLRGLERVPPARRLGITGYDTAPSFVAREPMSVEGGLGTVDEYKTAHRMAGHRPLKVAVPGPLTFGNFIGTGRRNPDDVLDELIRIVRTELLELAKAGCTYLQLDEPGLPHPPYDIEMKDAAEVINETLNGVPGRLAVHICYGNNAGRPMADRRLEQQMPALMEIGCDQLFLEFANKEMADIELLEPLSERFDIAAGVVDVKNFHIETAETVAERLRRVLEYVPAERLAATADCGFSAMPRYLARQKIGALVGGAQIVRRAL